MVNMQAARPQAPLPLPRDRLGNFQRTKPPTFSHVVEPMDADDCLKSVEKKLLRVQCNNCENVVLASHQIYGPAADWWCDRTPSGRGSSTRISLSDSQ
jgi:hypothetical protein